MAEASKKKTTKKAKKTAGAADAADAEEVTDAAPRPLESLVLDKKTGKYKIVEIISFWAKELRKLEEHRHLTQMEVLELAMREVLSGKVSEEDLNKKLAAAVPIHNGKDKKEIAAAQLGSKKKA